MKTRLGEAPPYILEALSYHAALRKLGYSTDDIYLCIVGEEPHLIVKVMLKIGEKKFVCDVARVTGLSKKTITSTWQAGAELWNSNDTSEKQRREVFEMSHVFKNKVGFLAALALRGFDAKKGLS